MFFSKNNIAKNVDECKLSQEKKGNEKSGSKHRRTRGFMRSRMKSKKRLEMVPEGSLIVAMDLSDASHCVWMATTTKEPLARIAVSNTPEGIDQMLAKAEEVKATNRLEKVVITMEPTGHYWKIVAQHLQKRSYEYVLVHTVSVRREKESSYYRHAKSDFKDAEAIANLVADRKFLFSKLPDNSLWAALKTTAREYLLTEVRLIAEGMRLSSFMELIYPEYKMIFKDLTKYTALSCMLSIEHAMTNKKMEFLAHARSHFKKRLYKSRMEELYDLIKSRSSWGCQLYTDGLLFSITNAAERYKLASEQHIRAEQKLLDYYDKTGYAPYSDSFTGVSRTMHALTLALIGDPLNYDCSRCVTKFAGMDIKENESGKYKGKTTIAHRGNPHLRYVSYLCGRVLSKRDIIWQQRYCYLINRSTKPLKINQAYVALGCKFLRIDWTLWKYRIFYDPVKATMGYDIYNNN